jgi:HEAT repeat protein
LSAIRQLLRKMSADRNEIVRMKVTEGLGLVGNSRDIALLSRLTLDRAWTVRSSAYSSLGQLGNQRALHLIMHGFRDSHPIVRRYAAVAAFDLIGCNAAQLLKAESGRYKATEARIGYLHVLAACGDLGSKLELESIAQDSNMRIASAATDALSGVGA